MKLNLNNPQEFTIDGVALLLASDDDSRNRQLLVGDDGFAYLTDNPDPKNLSGVRFRLESWAAGGGYVGEAAAEDKGWVRRVYTALRTNWEQTTEGYVDIY